MSFARFSCAAHRQVDKMSTPLKPNAFIACLLIPPDCGP
jgi:hypothetical protein